MQKEFVGRAKSLNAGLGGDLKRMMSALNDDMEVRMEEMVKRHVDGILTGKYKADGPTEKLVKQVKEAVLLTSRGMETKLLQKVEEAVGSWANAASKEAVEVLADQQEDAQKEKDQEKAKKAQKPEKPEL
eukprot:TRINITY_DN71273_c0_g1_i2.p2 TRINITY_DN71273_c0_g1~~TRINITY_DN71273_c0_g1_i2.p2  ORF type:complete len:130 (-),score=60.28 TRINITY_DN71273_c0_g1_i2:341-730(-)